MSVWTPPGRQTFFDPDTGQLLAFGKVYMYVPSTTIAKLTWADEAQSTVNTNPITLDGSGSCSIWGNGLYRQVLKDSLGNQIWDKVTGFVGGGSGGGDVFGPGSSTAGNIVLWGDNSGTSIVDGGPSLGIAQGGTGVTAVPTNGQLLIGNGTNYTLAALTAGSGVSITNGAGTITIAFTGGGTGTVTSVSGSGGTTGLTLTGGPITGAGTLTLGGTLAIANGGTGAATAAAALTAIGAEPAGQVLGINTQTGSYVLVLADAGEVVAMNVAGANTLTIPPNSSVAFPVKTRVDGGQLGAGQTTITAGAGVTIHAFSGGLKSVGQYAGWTLLKIGTDEWWAFGSLMA